MKKQFKQSLFLISVFALGILSSQAAFSGQLITPDIITINDSSGSNHIYAQRKLPNLCFGSINVHSRKGTYNIIAFKEYDYSASLFVENSSIKNVRVRAGIVDGKVFYDKMFAYISEGAPKRIEFTCILPVGTHTIYIEIDPENTIDELDEKDNRITRTFIANLFINAL
ncbi:MAG: hypothetical protein JRG81_07070 [Deltaproteobacteria bacterium]|nr:hypothetical protein [Deltaproteobacteria bacterium]